MKIFRLAVHFRRLHHAGGGHESANVSPVPSRATARTTPRRSAPRSPSACGRRCSGRRLSRSATPMNRRPRRSVDEEKSQVASSRESGASTTIPRSSGDVERVAHADPGACRRRGTSARAAPGRPLVALRHDSTPVAIPIRAQRLLADSRGSAASRRPAESDRRRWRRPPPESVAGHARHLPRMLAHTTLHDPHLGRLDGARRRHARLAAAAAHESSLAGAFADVDRLFTQFMATRATARRGVGRHRRNGRLAHAGVGGLRDVRREDAVTPDTVFRIASMTKSFTAIAILKLRDEGKLSLDDPAERYVPERPDEIRLERRAEDHDSTPAVARGGLSGRQPWGDRHLADTDEQLSRCCPRRHHRSRNAPGIAYEYPIAGLPSSGRHRHNVSKTKVRGVRRRQHPAPAGHERDDARAVGRGGEQLARAIDGKTSSGRTSAARERILRSSGTGGLTSVRDLRPLCSACSFGVAAARRSGDRAESGDRHWRRCSTCGRDAARPSRETRGRGAAEHGRLRLRPAHLAELRVPHDRVARWLAARVRVGDDLAPDYGLGIVAFATLTYTGWGGVATNALRCWREGRSPSAPARAVARAHGDARTRCRASWRNGTTASPTASRRRTCFWIRQGVAGARRSRACARPSAPAHRATASTRSRTRSAGRGR